MVKDINQTVCDVYSSIYFAELYQYSGCCSIGSMWQSFSWKAQLEACSSLVASKCDIYCDACLRHV